MTDVPGPDRSEDSSSEAPDDAIAPGDTVRSLLRGADRAVLSTADRGRGGWPYGSLVMLATAADAAPLLLISTLAEHTRNLEADPRASLLIDGTAGLADPLTGARATLLGRIARTEEPAHARRYLARHPAAAMYAGFKDFSYWRMQPESAHLVAGFGRIHWIEAAEILGPGDLPVQQAEADIVAHMNEDHADAIQLYAHILLGLDGEGWRMTGCDPEGVDLRLEGRIARLPFDAPVATPDEARRALVALVRRARESAE